MSRPLRLEFTGGLYHVTSRGDRREAIYQNDDDRNKWLELFSQVCKRFNWRCHAYCLMSNHYHVVVETVEGNLSKGMRQLNGVYTQGVRVSSRILAVSLFTAVLSKLVVVPANRKNIYVLVDAFIDNSVFLANSP